MTARAELRVLKGEHGADKVFCLAASEQPATATVVLFVGDQLEARHVPSEVLALQDPRRQAALMAAKFPGANVAVVMPSRVEGCFACFDHFLGRTTASGEPLGYGARDLKAAPQIASLLQDSGLWAPHRTQLPPPARAPATSPAKPRPPVPLFGDAASKVRAAGSDSALIAAAESAATIGAAAMAAISTQHQGLGSNTEISPTTGTSGANTAAEPLHGEVGPQLPFPAVILAGFSKGGVVLNQFLAELSAWADQAAERATSNHDASSERTRAPIAAVSGAWQAADTAGPAAEGGGGGASRAGAGSAGGRGTTWEQSQVGALRQGALHAMGAVPPNGGVGRTGSAAPTQAPHVAAPPSKATEALLEAVTQLHYLDVGLNCRGAFMTDPNVANSLQRLAAGGVGERGADVQPKLPHVFLHGTPRQWDDPTRPWVGREAQTSARLLRNAGLPVTVQKYFRDHKPSLAMHFDVLQKFCTRPNA